MEKQITITEDIAELIIAAIGICFSESCIGVIDIYGNKDASYARYYAVERFLVELLYEQFPEIIEKYSWIDVVKKVINDEQE